MRRSAAALLAIGVAACGGGPDRHDKNADANEAGPCLRKEGARVTGDPKARPQPGDTDAPDHELIASLQDTSAFIAFYDSEARAKALEPGIRKNAERFKGVVVRDQNTTVIYTKKPSDDFREKVEGCVF